MDSYVVPHHSTNMSAPWLTAQIGRDAVLSESYGRRCQLAAKAQHKGKEKGPGRGKGRGEKGIQPGHTLRDFCST